MFLFNNDFFNYWNVLKPTEPDDLYKTAFLKTKEVTSPLGQIKQVFLHADSQKGNHIKNEFKKR